MIPADTDLRDTGLAPIGAGRTLVIACGALAREIIALIDMNGLTHLTLTCLPAILHNDPRKIPQAIENAVYKHKEDYDEILIAYGDCGTGGQLQSLCDRLGVTMIDAPHCYAFFDGTKTFAQRGEVTSFYLTDFLARQFDAFVWEPLGLARYPDLRDAYFGNYETLVYLAQTENADLTAKARDAAERLGLGFERRYTSFGDLEPFLTTGSGS
ncbi:DUF1638 domain-containing protein [Celeribacter arenosi]|uniref:DUF1638 domain-containing protein n=1 Tax=Celeribacter arenosi TaxID=792649 RepID=A0ABP7KHJ9_9RHOB